MQTYQPQGGHLQPLGDDRKATSNKRKLCVRSRAQSNHLVTGDFRGHDASFSARPLEAPGCSVYADRKKQQGYL